MSLYGSVGAVLDVLSNVDTGDSATGEISVALRNQIKGLLEDIRTTVVDAGFNTFDSVSEIDLADIVDEGTDATIISTRIQTWRNLLTDSTDTGAGLAELITNLKSIITPVAYGLLAKNFFGADQVENQNIAQIGARFDSAFAFPTLVSPDYQLLVTLLNNANIAIDSLQEFQTLFGSENVVASVTANTGTGEFSYGSNGVYGKGFTGDGTGLTASQLITGNVRTTESGSIVSAYDGLRKALDLIIGQTSAYNNFLQDPSDQTVEFPDGTAPLLQTLEGDTIIFQGTPQDILSPSTYNSLVALITASLESTDPENPGGTDPDAITNTALNAINSAVQVAFQKTVANYDFALRNSFVSSNENPAFTFIDGTTAGTLPGAGFAIGGRNADLDGDGTVATSDLLSMLALFGNDVESVTIGQITDNVTSFVDQNKFSEFSQTGVGAQESFEFEEGDSTPAFISAIAAALSPYIPSNKQIIFNPETQEFELGFIS